MTAETAGGLATGIIAWYDFKAGTEALVIAGDSVLSDHLAGRGIKTRSLSIAESARDPFLKASCGCFDYVIAIGMLEKCREPLLMLKHWGSLLKAGGHLLLGAENRLGVRYFCGERDPATGEVFQGIEHYHHKQPESVKVMKHRLYAKSELTAFLDSAGFNSRSCYSVFPRLESARFIYAEDYLPNEDVSMRIVPQYDSCGTVMIDEQHLYTDLIENRLFHQMANAFLFDCSSETTSGILSVTVSAERDERLRTATVIRAGGTVEKRALTDASLENLRKIEENLAYLKSRGIQTVPAGLSGHSLSMPYIEGQPAVQYLRDLLASDREKLIEEMDHFRDLILKSSPRVEKPENIIPGYTEADGIILEKAFVDMVPINAFYSGEDFVFIDQEFCFENYPANAIIFRMVAFLYDLNSDRMALLPQDFFFDRYGISANMAKWIAMSIDFAKSLCTDEKLLRYSTQHTVSYNRIEANRRKLDAHVIGDCFSGITGKNVYIWGCGNFASKFYAFYKNDFTIAGIVDSSSAKWGTMFHDKPVSPPRILNDCDRKNSKVIICMKDFWEVYLQLQDMGFENIGVYDANRIYDGRQGAVSCLLRREGNTTRKKYRVGYIAGVFDLFHIGHLNMFRRAKDLCDYLIAAVVTDKGVRDGKKREPYIPFEERIEMVRSCRYVDEAVEIPYDYPGTVEAFQKYHFDVQFSGSDYVNHPWWLEQQKWLREHGADLVFFPYTEQTSSTKIKALIEKGLL